MHDHRKSLKVFQEGVVIPATPLALTSDRKIDEYTQRLLMRYYLNAGSGGIATAVHSTQFAIRSFGMFEPLISIVSEEIDKFEQQTGTSKIKICGACGPTEQAVNETRLAKKHGFDAVLLSPGGLNNMSEYYMIDRTKAVSEILPVIGFYLQNAVGGRIFSYDYWKRTATVEGVIGIKCASFNRYTTVDVMRAVCNSPRHDRITMYTGNDDNIINDLISEFSFNGVTKRFEGGLLGHWCVWTRKATEILNMVKTARKTGNYKELIGLGPQITDMNAVIFDSVNSFKGCIPGIHEVLRRQGLMKNILCLDPEETLSEGQNEEISRILENYPQLLDDDFITSNINKWKTQA